MTKAPDFPIAPILQWLGAQDVPDVTKKTRIRCVFHEERNPSAEIGPYSYTCYVCPDASGDALKLLMTRGGLEFVDAIRLCEELTGTTSRDIPSAAQNQWSSAELSL